MDEPGDARLRAMVEDTPDPGGRHQRTERHAQRPIRAWRPGYRCDEGDSDNDIGQARPRIRGLGEHAAAGDLTVGGPKRQC